MVLIMMFFYISDLFNLKLVWILRCGWVPIFKLPVKNWQFWRFGKNEKFINQSFQKKEW